MGQDIDFEVDLGEGAFSRRRLSGLLRWRDEHGEVEIENDGGSGTGTARS